MKKNFLVTGGAGFIGSHLVEFLLSIGHSVTVIDDLSTGHKKNINILNERLTFINDTIQSYIVNCTDKFDGIFHLAAQASVPLSIEIFSQSSLNNLESTINVFEYCKQGMIPCIYASSSAVYGNLEYSSEDSLLDFLSPYSVDKYVMELYSQVLHNIHGCPFFGFRFFNVYGPRQDPKSPYSGVISIFIDRLLTNSEIFINDGRQTRDFVYVEDVAKLLFMAYEHTVFSPGNYVLNLGTGKSVTINKIFDIIKNELNSSKMPSYRPLPVGDPFISVCDSTNFDKYFRNFNFTSLEDGIKKTIGDL